MSAYKIRPAKAEDLSFIYDTWLNVVRYDTDFGKCRNSVFFNEYKLVIDRILSISETLVAHDPANEDLIFAYLVYEAPFLLHFCFCKEAFRGLGIATALFVQAFGSKDFKVEVTHRTSRVIDLMWKHQNLVHNPFHLFKKGAV